MSLIQVAYGLGYFTASSISPPGLGYFVASSISPPLTPALFRAFPVPLWPGVLRGEGDRADWGGPKPASRGLQQPRAVCARQGRRVSVCSKLCWVIGGMGTPTPEGGNSTA